MRIPLIAGNWKMNTTISEGVKLVQKLIEFSKTTQNNVEMLVCVPFTALYPIKQLTEGTKIKLGAQNVYFEESGAFTGEISPIMLKDIGVDYVIIGHSERRQYFDETDEIVNKKIKAVLRHGMKAIMCVGETLEQRENELQEEVVKSQIINGLKEIDSELMKNIVIAYEPIWAIGTGKTATSEQANEIISFIRNVVLSLYGKDISENIVIQYGGSVKSSNVSEIMAMSDIDGALVGGASLKADEFIKILNYQEIQHG